MQAEEMTSPEFQKAIEEDRVFIIPIGSMEEHGPHLPLGTDMFQPLALMGELAERTGAVILPAMPYGVCNFTAGFPGTVSLSFDTIRGFARDVAGELAYQGVKRMIFLTGHAGSSHIAGLKQGAREAMGDNHLAIYVLSDYDFAYSRKDLPQDDGHGGLLETSRIMDIRPELVKEKRPVCHPDIPRFKIIQCGKEYIPDGIHGDASKATAEYGRLVNKDILAELIALVEQVKEEKI